MLCGGQRTPWCRRCFPQHGGPEIKHSLTLLSHCAAWEPHITFSAYLHFRTLTQCPYLRYIVKFDSRQERGAVLPGGDSRNHGCRAPPGSLRTLSTGQFMSNFNFFLLPVFGGRVWEVSGSLRKTLCLIQEIAVSREWVRTNVLSSFLEVEVVTMEHLDFLFSFIENGFFKTYIFWVPFPLLLPVPPHFPFLSGSTPFLVLLSKSGFQGIIIKQDIESRQIRMWLKNQT